MPLSMDDLTVSLAPFDQASLLADWTWLIGPLRFPVLLTAAGDAFLQHADDGRIDFLNSEAADLTPIAGSVDEFRSRLTDPEFVAAYFAAQMIGDLLASDAELEPGEVFALTVPSVLGGEFTLDNIKGTDGSVHFSLLGQMHEKVRALPPGTMITEFTIE